jgi:hypothetical protein
MFRHKAAWIGLTVVAVSLVWALLLTSGPDLTPRGLVETKRAFREPIRQEPEAWVADLARDGQAVVRTLVAGQDDHAHDTSFKTLGSLSVDGVNSVVGLIEEELGQLEQDLDAALDAPDLGSMSALQRYSRDLRMVRRMQLLRARREQIRVGAYITFPLAGGDVPPTPKGVSQWQGGPFSLEAGGFGQILVWVDTSRRAGIAEIDRALQEVAVAEADDAIRTFQARPDDDRRRWIERLDELERKRADGLPAMSETEMLELAAMKTQIKHMRARVDRTHTTLYR